MNSTKSMDGIYGSGGMAVSVTRHALTPIVEEFRYLIHGIDTLDIGLYVAWGPGWKRRLQDLDKKKLRARKQKDLLIRMPSGRICNFRPGGKGENYRYHLQYEAFNLYIGKAAKPGKTPNAYLSINAKTLWLNGIETALAWIDEDLKAIGGGIIQSVKISRVDLCADFWMKGGLSYEFLKSHKVTHNEKNKFWMGGDALETFYAGDEKSPIQLRIYNKGLEIEKGGKKLWFKDLWEIESLDNIWRVEFQLRRPALKQFGINTLEDLNRKKAGVWDYLTTKWFSLRIADNAKAERREFHPFWIAVNKAFKQEDSDTEITRVYRLPGIGSQEWHLSHIEGCLSSFAAHLGISNRDEALNELQRRLSKRRDEREFETDCIKKAIRLGTLSDGGCR